MTYKLYPLNYIENNLILLNLNLYDLESFIFTWIQFNFPQNIFSWFYKLILELNTWVISIIILEEDFIAYRRFIKAIIVKKFTYFFGHKEKFYYYFRLFYI